MNRTVTIISNPNGKNGVTAPIKVACIIEADGKYLDDEGTLSLERTEAFIFSGRNRAKEVCGSLVRMGIRKTKVIELEQDELKQMIDLKKSKLNKIES